MKQLKLKDLYHECRKLMEEGHGEKSLVTASDNEGNSYHGMYFSLTVINHENVDDFSGLIRDNNEPNIHNIIVVG